MCKFLLLICISIIQSDFLIPLKRVKFIEIIDLNDNANEKMQQKLTKIKNNSKISNFFDTLLHSNIKTKLENTVNYILIIKAAS
jgi:hypothetical protein